jgi:glycerol-3-phosphate acyltransferase PlsX
MKQEFTRNPLRILGCLFLRGALKSMKKRLDPELHGGAPLLGVNGVCIIAHGGSSRRAIYNAIRVASESVHNHLNEDISAEIKKLEAI